MNSIRILFVTDVAAIIGNSAAYIRNEIRKHPTDFPPVLKGRKGTRLRFREADVYSWLDGLEIQKRASRS